MIAPAFLANATHSASSFDLVFLRDKSPKVCSLARTHVLSFVVNGTPKNGFCANSSSEICLRAIRSSICFASSNASLTNGPSTIAFSILFT